MLDIKQEKQHLELLEGVTKFNKGKLKRADTLEKDVLPTKEGLNLDACSVFLRSFANTHLSADWVKFCNHKTSFCEV